MVMMSKQYMNARVKVLPEVTKELLLMIIVFLSIYLSINANHLTAVLSAVPLAIKMKHIGILIVTMLNVMCSATARFV